jgi:hypothetical protein
MQTRSTIASYSVATDLKQRNQMWNDATGDEYERGNNRNASDPAVGEFVDTELPALRFDRMFVPACESLADLDCLYRFLSSRLGINFKGK